MYVALLGKSLLIAVVLASVAAPAAAGLTASIVGPSSPVRIDACSAGFGADKVSLGLGLSVSQQDSSLVGATYDFTNVGEKPIKTIRFHFREVDAFGEGLQLAAFDSDWTGDVAPGQSFTKNTALGSTLNPNIASVQCSVAKVLFDDGSVWSAGQVSAGGLYYPSPVPSP